MLERNTTPPPGKITIQPKILVLIIVAVVVIALLLTSFLSLTKQNRALFSGLAIIIVSSVRGFNSNYHLGSRRTSMFRLR